MTDFNRRCKTACDADGNCLSWKTLFMEFGWDTTLGEKETYVYCQHSTDGVLSKNYDISDPRWTSDLGYKVIGIETEDGENIDLTFGPICESGHSAKNKCTEKCIVTDLPECQCNDEGRKLGVGGRDSDYCTLVQPACMHPVTKNINKKDYKGKYEQSVSCKDTTICPTAFNKAKCCDDVVPDICARFAHGTDNRYKCGSEWANKYCQETCGFNAGCIPQNFAMSRPDADLLAQECRH